MCANPIRHLPHNVVSHLVFLGSREEFHGPSQSHDS